ncbi:hypothetical protein BS50DRAFT_507539, partial [Corynespora cassiicola Philippines]
GAYQEAKNLTHVIFYSSSHIVPFDYPERTLDMLGRFVSVNINSIGSKPSDSRINGEKGSSAGAEAHLNAANVQEDKTEEVKKVERKAYPRSGEVAPVAAILAIGLWSYLTWRKRRRRVSYKSVTTREMEGEDARESLMNLEGFRS